MRREAKQLAELAQLTGVAQDAALSKLRAAISAREAVEAQIKALDQQRRRATPDVSDAVTLTGADLLWQRWAALRRADLNKQLARLRVTEAGARDTARTAFGRAQAVRELWK